MGPIAHSAFYTNGPARRTAEIRAITDAVVRRVAAWLRAPSPR